MSKARCMHCQRIHPKYRFRLGQLCYVLWCENCGTSMHEPAVSGLTPFAVDTDVAESSERIEKMVKEISSAVGVPPKYWQRH